MENNIVAMTREEHESAFNMLGTHFNISVGEKELLKAWELFKQDYCKQITDNTSLKAQRDEVRKYIYDHTDTIELNECHIGLTFGNNEPQCIYEILNLIDKKEHIHDKEYDDLIRMSNPPKRQWICKTCSEIGYDTLDKKEGKE